jgi:UDP-glucose 4-epimerase
MAKAFVSGAAGFIGSHLTRHLHAAGHRVVALDDFSGGFLENLDSCLSGPGGITFVEGSVTDHELLADLFDHVDGFDYVFHLAAYAAEGLSHFIRRFNYVNNVVGSVNLINEAVRHSAKRFVFTSSIAVYGTNQLPMTEALTPQPGDPYGIGKYAVELDLRAAHEMFGLDYTIFRPHNVYGEGQNIADRYRNVVGIFMNQLLHDQPMTVFGDGQQSRGFTYIDDVAPIIASCPDIALSANRTFNIGASDPYTVLDLARIVARAFGIDDPSIEHLAPRDEVLHAFASHAELHSVFGAPEVIDLETGVERMARWARTIGPRYPVGFNEIELRRNMPPSWEPHQNTARS